MNSRQQCEWHEPQSSCSAVTGSAGRRQCRCSLADQHCRYRDVAGPHDAQAPNHTNTVNSCHFQAIIIIIIIINFVCQYQVGMRSLIYTQTQKWMVINKRTISQKYEQAHIKLSVQDTVTWPRWGQLRTRQTQLQSRGSGHLEQPPSTSALALDVQRTISVWSKNARLPASLQCFDAVGWAVGRA